MFLWEITEIPVPEPSTVPEPYRNRTEELGTVLGSTFSIFSVLGSFGAVPVWDGSSTMDTPNVEPQVLKWGCQLPSR